LRREFAEHLAKFYWKPVFWSRSYCIVSCGGAPLEIVKRYLESQNEPG
jgi:putative transposase